MAYGAGKDSALKITAAGGADLGTNITAYLTSIDPSFSVDTAEVSTMGDSWREYIATLKDATLACEGIWDPTPGTVFFNLLGGTAAPIRYFPQGTASGKLYFDGSAILTEYTPPSDLEEAVTFSATFQFSGGVTYGTA